MLKTAIPFIDLRGKTPTDLLRAFPDKASTLMAASRRTYGFATQLASLVALPVADAQSRAWLQRNRNPYLHEIQTAADVLGVSGLYALNLSEAWACTSGAYLVGEQVQLLRVLDWPFPDLGKHIVVALQSSAAGEYYNITWPGVSGVFQATAPQRFAAAINLAPMRKHGLGLAGDWIVNRVQTAREKGLPPSHLLRQVFDQAKSYAEAKEMLCTVPLATPIIYTLAGLKPGEGCVIERLENAAEVIELAATHRVSASNEFHSGFASYGKGWRPRMVDSAGRYRQSREVNIYDLQQAHFDWLRPPMLNEMTRLVMQANAQSGMLMVQGYEGQGAVTNTFVIPAVSH